MTSLNKHTSINYVWNDKLLYWKYFHFIRIDSLQFLLSYLNVYNFNNLFMFDFFQLLVNFMSPWRINAFYKYWPVLFNYIGQSFNNILLLKACKNIVLEITNWNKILLSFFEKINIYVRFSALSLRNFHYNNVSFQHNLSCYKCIS